MEQNIPKYTTDSLAIRTNHYVVEQDGSFHYFPIKADDSTLDSPVIRLTKRPPVLLDGVVILGRTMYEVTVRDILRGVVRKSSLVSSGRVNASRRVRGNAGSPDPQSSGSVAIGGSSSNTGYSNEPELEQLDGLEIAEAAHLAWQEQAGALLQALHQKEGGEWEIASAVQPGQIDAGSAVSDPDTDSGDDSST